MSHDVLKELPANVTVSYVSDASDRYGTAAAVYAARDDIDVTRPVAVMMGDDFVFNKPGVSELAEMVAGMGRQQSTTGLMAAKIPKSLVSNYGVIDHDGDTYRRIIDKPLPCLLYTSPSPRD